MKSKNIITFINLFLILLMKVNIYSIELNFKTVKEFQINVMELKPEDLKISSMTCYKNYLYVLTLNGYLIKINKDNFNIDSYFKTLPMENEKLAKRIVNQIKEKYKIKKSHVQNSKVGVYGTGIEIVNDKIWIISSSASVKSYFIYSLDGHLIKNKKHLFKQNNSITLADNYILFSGCKINQDKEWINFLAKYDYKKEIIVKENILPRKLIKRSNLQRIFHDMTFYKNKYIIGSYTSFRPMIGILNLNSLAFNKIKYIDRKNIANDENNGSFSYYKNNKNKIFLIRGLASDEKYIYIGYNKSDKCKIKKVILEGL